MIFYTVYKTGTSSFNGDALPSLLPRGLEVGSRRAQFDVGPVGFA
jgi:hypothetical protein